MVFCSHPWLFGHGLARARDLRSRREGNFGRQGGDLTTTSPGSACLSWVPPAVVMAVTCLRWEGDLLLCRPFMKGKIIPPGQQLHRMKEWLEFCGTGKMVVVREEPQHRATWSVPCLWGREAGLLGQPETVTSLLRKLRDLSLTQKFPNKNFSLASLLSPCTLNCLML